MADRERRYFELVDDGTMDTVLKCRSCGEELRYNPEPEEGEDRVKLAEILAAIDHGLECGE